MANFCLSCSLDRKLLEKATEIKFTYDEIYSIFRCHEEFPDKDLILVLNSNDIDYANIENISNTCDNKLICGCVNTAQVFFCMRAKIRFIYMREIQNYQDLNNIIKCGAEGVYVGSPLFFQQDTLKQFNVKFRKYLNSIIPMYIPIDLDICYGSWIRPEDIDLYENFTFEFLNVDKLKEEALFKAYEGRVWNFNLLYLISDDYDEKDIVSNPLISPDMVKRRLNCGHACQLGRCHLCSKIFDFANPDKYKGLFEK